MSSGRQKTTPPIRNKNQKRPLNQRPLYDKWKARAAHPRGGGGAAFTRIRSRSGRKSKIVCSRAVRCRSSGRNSRRPHIIPFPIDGLLLDTVLMRSGGTGEIFIVDDFTPRTSWSFSARRYRPGWRYLSQWADRTRMAFTLSKMRIWRASEEILLSPFQFAAVGRKDLSDICGGLYIIGQQRAKMIVEVLHLFMI